MKKLETGTEISEQPKSKHQKLQTSERNRDFLVLEAKETRRQLLPKFQLQNIPHSLHLPLLSLWIRKSLLLHMHVCKGTQAELLAMCLISRKVAYKEKTQNPDIETVKKMKLKSENKKEI